MFSVACMHVCVGMSIRISGAHQVYEGRPPSIDTKDLGSKAGKRSENYMNHVKDKSGAVN